jgi:hypothetical protein
VLSFGVRQHVAALEGCDMSQHSKLEPHPGAQVELPFLALKNERAGGKDRFLADPIFLIKEVLNIQSYPPVTGVIGELGRPLRHRRE